jgi:peptide/nickel transport system ATP-binding protein
VIQLAGEESNVLKLSEHHLKQLRGNKVSMVFQEPMTALNPLMHCGKQVLEIILQHRNLTKQNAKQEVLQLFKQVQLPEPEKKYDAYPHQLSGGQKQRVMIAMALANKPALIIADEPTTALDVTVQAGILQLMRELVQQNKTGMLFISHDLAVVSSICNKLAVMYNGEIVEQGTARTVLENPQHPYTRALLACRPAAHQSNRRLPVVSDFMTTDGVKPAKSSALEKKNVTVTDEPLLEVSNLMKSYKTGGMFSKQHKEFVAVNDVSFQLKQGETLGLVGESGCGKTTLSRCLLMLIHPDSGSVKYRGVNITKMNSEQLRVWRKKVQIIFQDPYSSLNPRISIGRSISEAILFHKIEGSGKKAKERVQHLLEQVGLKAEHYNRYPHEFSGGQRQRICIARALSVEPEFIICDESVSALDVSVQAQILNLLNDLKATFGLSYLFISHDLSVVRYMSNRIMVMQQGRIVEEAEPHTLFETPQTDYTKKLLASIPRLHFEN